MSAPSNEVLITVPVELTRQCKGIALDLGSSISKFLYRTAEDAQNAKSDDAKFGQLHCSVYSKSSLDEALEYVAQRADVTRPAGLDQPTIYTTGVGCTEHGKKICSKLNIRLEQVTEFDCFAQAFLYLASRLPRSQFLEPFAEEAAVEPIAQMKEQMALMMTIKADNETKAMSVDPAAFEMGIQAAVGRPSAAVLEVADTVPLAEAEPDIFPCLLVMCGSGIGLTRIEKDGTFKVIDGIHRGGKSFIGIGSLLTKCKSFDELVELAVKGDQRPVDIFSDEFIKSNAESAEGDESMYQKCASFEIQHPMLVFNFGKAIGATIEDFKREDLARSWLHYIVVDLVQCLQNILDKHGIRRAFLCGGFTSHPFIRSTITTEFIRRNLFQLAITHTISHQFRPTIKLNSSNPPPASYQLDFIRPGSHLGAIGCMVNEIEKFAGKKN